MRVVGLIALAFFAGTARAETLPPFDICFARAVAHFEMGFARNGAAETVEDYALVTRDRVHHCGTLAIVACDRSAAPQMCQRALAADQQALTEHILQSLPPPAEVSPPASLPGLYPQLWDVAHGASAGDDCAGADEPVAAWCFAHEARLKLTEAVALWQVARLIGVAGPAVELGWVTDAMPFAPVPRPEAEGSR